MYNKIKMESVETFHAHLSGMMCA